MNVRMKRTRCLTRIVKPDETSRTDFIVKFEQHSTKCKKYDMVLADAVLVFTSSGHYCVNILDIHYETNPDEEVLITQENMTNDQRKNMILKLHKQLDMHLRSDERS